MRNVRLSGRYAGGKNAPRHLVPARGPSTFDGVVNVICTGAFVDMGTDDYMKVIHRMMQDKPALLPLELVKQDDRKGLPLWKGE